jgi:transcription-repair coupling factor (superfamily II helicase)
VAEIEQSSQELREIDADKYSNELSYLPELTHVLSGKFTIGEYLVVPQHGVGKLLTIERAEISELVLEVLVISFKNDKLTLRVPMNKVRAIGIRRLTDEI